jgi:hypothetical protein
MCNMLTDFMVPRRAGALQTCNQVMLPAIICIETLQRVRYINYAPAVLTCAPPL